MVEQVDAANQLRLIWRQGSDADWRVKIGCSLRGEATSGGFHALAPLGAVDAEDMWTISIGLTILPAKLFSGWSRVSLESWPEDILTGPLVVRAVCAAPRSRSIPAPAFRHGTPFVISGLEFPDLSSLAGLGR